MKPSNTPKQYNSRKVWKRAFTAGLGFFVLGFVLTVFNSSQTCISSILSWGHDEELLIALMTALPLFGALFGGLSSGIMSKYYGKRALLIFNDLITIFGSLLVIYPNTITFGLTRFIQGFAGGSFSMISPQYVSEFTPIQVYSKMAIISPLNAMIGNLAANLLCQALPENGCHKDISFIVMLLFAFPLVIAGFQLFMFLKVFKKESPIWLRRTGNVELAYFSNESIFGTSYAVREMDKEQKLVEKNESNKEESFLDLICCKRGTTKGMRLGVMMHFLLQMSGINCITMYSTLLFIDIGEGLLLARTLTSLSTFSRIVAALLLLPIVSKLKSRSIAITGHFVMAVNLLMIGFISKYPYLKYLTVANIFIYVMAFGASIGPICWSYSSQVMPDKGMAIGTAVNWGIGTILVLLFPFIISFVGFDGCFFIFAGFNFFGFIYCCLDLVDISGKNKQEIREMLAKKR